MKYTKKKNKIVIDNLADFSIKQILECGQIFSYSCVGFNQYYVFSDDKFARVFEDGEKAVIETDDVDYFESFFDLKTDYESIKNKLSKFKMMKKPLVFGSGIRILKQNYFEMLISFAISANNNIKRIQKSVFYIREHFGKNMGKYFAFPTREELSKATEDDFKKAGCGYRSKQLVKLVSQLEDVSFDEKVKLSTTELKYWLISLSGVGPKVSDCVLLFGFSRGDVFPVDTWIEKVWNDNFVEKKTRLQISRCLVDMFGNLSGYAQQYLFYYKRTNK